jgi:hypothetical protein
MCSPICIHKLGKAQTHIKFMRFWVVRLYYKGFIVILCSSNKSSTLFSVNTKVID